jgi:glycosyltransferase involved in cell wall biosynthesis
MRVAVVIPAYQAEGSIAEVVSAVRRLWPDRSAPLLVVDDGSRDGTAAVAARAGARVIRHLGNRGKGFALRTGFAHALADGATHAVTLDADGQHPVEEAARLAELAHPEALVLGVRDLVRDGAPKRNQRSNAISNYFLSRFTGRALLDTHCGLRRYPLRRTLDLNAFAHGFGYEAEVILRAARANWVILEEPVRVVYPPEELRQTHFHAVRDPSRIILRVLATLATARPPGNSGEPA